MIADKTEIPEVVGPSPESQREKLHGEINSEIQSLEIAAQSLVDFPSVPWELRLELARQCWDETRHARLCMRRLVDKSGYKGEFPIHNQEWGVVCMFDSLAARLAVQNRTFEGGSLDTFVDMIAWWEELGDHETSAIMDGILADEIRHAAFANEWIERLGAEDPSIILRAAAAMGTIKQWIPALAGASQETMEARRQHASIPYNTEDRRRAGFRG